MLARKLASLGLPITVLAALGVGGIAALLASGLSVGAAVDAAVHPVAMIVLLSLVSLPLIRWAARGDVLIYRLLLGGLVGKAAGTFLRYRLTGDGDNIAYHEVGTEVAGWLGESIVGPSGLPGDFGSTGTDWLGYMVGWLYYFTGPRRLTAFVVFSFLGFIGLLFFYRAATSAIAELDRVRYASLLFFMPSMLFWPSTIGKEAWMICFLGLAAMGVSGLVQQRLAPHYFLALLVGLGLVARIRPHMAAVVAIALVAALVWPSGGKGKRHRQILAAVVGIAFLSVAMGEVTEFFSAAEGTDFTAVLDFTQARTSDGGSEFTPVRITGPQNLVQGSVSVMFRPFVFEAANTFQLLGSLESLLLIIVAVMSIGRLRSLPAMFHRNGYVRFVVVYMFAWMIAFSAISNFGILARQRAQLWPIFLIMFALPSKTSKWAPTASRRWSRRPAEPQPTDVYAD